MDYCQTSAADLGEVHNRDILVTENKYSHLFRQIDAGSRLGQHLRHFAHVITTLDYRGPVLYLLLMFVCFE